MVLALVTCLQAAPPVYDHIVVAIEENHTFQQIIGNTAEAPFFNYLAAGGVSLTDFYGLTHPSQPNYIHLFSGDSQGITDNGKPLGRPFSYPNLGAALYTAGRSFVGFAEDLPAPGDTETEATFHPVLGNILYARKHVPWTNWQDSTTPTPPNRLPPTANLPFDFFPEDYATLPTVSFVTPSQLNDMHDGSIAMADKWLQAHLGAYAEWARTHNSLLIVTWDEDSFASRNRIPTILYGAHLRRGTQPATGTLHNLLRTLADLYALPPMGAAARVASIPGLFVNEPATRTYLFRHGLENYFGVEDTQIRQNQPATSFGVTPLLAATLDDGAVAQGLVLFNGIFGPNGIPPGAQILSAKLLVTTGGASGDTSNSSVEVRRMLVPWNDSATWSSFGGGLSAEALEVAADSEFTLTPNLGFVPAIFDVTRSLKDFATGAPNRGWALLATSADSWRWSSSEEPEEVQRPTLSVTVAANEVQFSAPYFTVREDAGSATITVTRVGSAPGQVSVDYTTSDGTALADEDYSPRSGTLTWAAGDLSSRTITVPVVLNSTVEGLESLRVTLSNPRGLAVLGPNASVPLFLVERPFDQWRVDSFGESADTASALPAGDFDADGSINLHEYAFATNPRDAASRVQPTMIDGSALTISFLHPKASDELIYTVQVSSDLITWFDGSRYSAAGDVASNTYTTQVSRSGTPVETIVVRDNVLRTAASRRFLRVNVKLP